MNERTCLDIFTGLGCFSIAARANGVRTVAMCEREQRCRNFLLANWPGIPVAPDIKTFDAKPYRGVWLLAGGPPCQPASLAGKRRGAADNRWLWPHALRIVDEAEPTWFLFENPPGIDGVGLDGVLADLEGKNYEVQTLNIPACAVNSPQLRKRLWIVGHANRMRQDSSQAGSENNGSKGALGIHDEHRKSFRPSEDCGLAISNGQPGECRQLDAQRGSQWRDVDGRAIADGALANGDNPGLAQRQGERGNDGAKCAPIKRSDCAQQIADLWREYQWIECGDGKYRRAKPGVCGLVDGPPVGLLEALGNAIVWPVAAHIIAAMIQAEL